MNTPPRHQVTRDRGIAFAFAALLFVVDQLVKWWVVGPLNLVEVRHIDLLPFFDLTFTQNFGVSLGMFTADSAETRWLLVGVTSVIALVVAVWMLREKRLWDLIGLAMILGGAFGNILDRIRFGYVVDYADFHIGTFRPFLIFNIADAAITIGVLIILARSLFMGEKPKK
ncbi:signal peptidase II [Altericroceibacterium endophyticum]|uniref:Lipoprotein signal peptidase n=1 Tax=Altericroceibacterium endophyticum TaxID=1808508 RepID=A0A6I4T397_9SPHN|nr:signal peptidase II [Altericroceibacterium endophyticum]MXO65724.1 signal peptidase II [Altericroceibacterium endophyticum]